VSSLLRVKPGDPSNSYVIQKLESHAAVGERMPLGGSVREDQRARYSLVYEFTPIPFLQLRAGYRRYRGLIGSAAARRVPQNFKSDAVRPHSPWAM
jgi:hypothetical protein